jgi:putative oxidoreductase
MTNANLADTAPASASMPSTPKPIIPVLHGLATLLSPVAEPMVRVTAGLLLVPHGAQKLFGLFGGYGLEATGQFFASKLGLPASFALLAGLIECVGGLMLALGFATRAVAVLVFGVMAVAVVSVHLPNGFFWTSGGYEYPLLWAVVALSYALRGGGRFSLDYLIGYEF